MIKLDPCKCWVMVSHKLRLVLCSDRILSSQCLSGCTSMLGFHIIIFACYLHRQTKACSYHWQHVGLAEHPVIAHAHWGKHWQVISCPQLLTVFYTSAALQHQHNHDTNASDDSSTHQKITPWKCWHSTLMVHPGMRLRQRPRGRQTTMVPPRWTTTMTSTIITTARQPPLTPLSNNPANLVPRRQHLIRSCTPTTLLVANRSQCRIRIRLQQLPRHAAWCPHILHAQRCRASPSRKLLLQRHHTSLQCTFTPSSLSHFAANTPFIPWQIGHSTNCVQRLN